MNIRLANSLLTTAQKAAIALFAAIVLMRAKLSCTHKKKQLNSDNPLAKFKSRELILELRNRGYSGKLVLTQEVVI